VAGLSPGHFFCLERGTTAMRHAARFPSYPRPQYNRAMSHPLYEVAQLARHRLA